MARKVESARPDAPVLLFMSSVKLWGLFTSAVEDEQRGEAKTAKHERRGFWADPDLERLEANAVQALNVRISTGNKVDIVQCRCARGVVKSYRLIIARVVIRVVPRSHFNCGGSDRQTSIHFPLSPQSTAICLWTAAGTCCRTTKKVSLCASNGD